MLGKVSIAIEAQLARFESDMGRAARLAEKDLKRIERAGDEAMRELKSDAKAAGAVLGTVLVAGAYAAGAAIRNMLQEARDVQKFAALANVGTDTFQKLAAGARTVGIEQDKLADIFKDTQDKVGDYLQNEGGELKDFFDNIAGKVGVTAKEFANLSGPQALQLYVTSLQKAGISQAEMVFYMEALANDASLLLPLLRDGGAGFQKWGEEAQRAGAVMNGETLKAAGELSSEISRLKLQVDGMWKEALPQVIPQLRELANTLNSSEMRDGFANMVSGAATAIGWLAKLATTTANVSKFVGEEIAARINGPDAADIVRVEDRIKRLKTTIAAVEGAGPSLRGALSFINASELVPGDFLSTKPTVLKRLQSELSKEQNKLSVGLEMGQDAARRAQALAAEAAKAPTVAPAVNLTGVGLRRKARDDASKAASKEQDEAKRRAEELQRTYESTAASLQRQAALLGETGEAARVRYEIERGALKSLEPALQQKLLADAEALDKARDALDLKKRQDDAAKQEAERLDQFMSDLRFETDLLGMNNAEREVAIALRQAGVRATDESAAAIRREIEEIQRLREADAAMQDVRAAAVDMFASFLDGSQSAGDAFEDFTKRLRRLAAQMLAEKAIQYLFNAFAGGGGQGSGFMGWASGNPLSGGWSSGGYTGAGGVNQPAGVVHKGEVVWSQRDVARAGGVGVVEAMRRGTRGYADGGVVGGVGPAGGYRNVIIHNYAGGNARTEEQPAGDGSGMKDLVVFIENTSRSALSRDVATGTGFARTLEGAYGMRRAGASRG